MKITFATDDTQIMSRLIDSLRWEDVTIVMDDDHVIDGCLESLMFNPLSGLQVSVTANSESGRTYAAPALASIDTIYVRTGKENK